VVLRRQLRAERCDIELANLARAARSIIAIYEKLAAVISRGIDGLEGKTLSLSEVLMAFRLLGPTLENLAGLRGTLEAQRGTEAVDVTPAGSSAQILDKTKELLRERFNAKAN
jgi:hypothetical protein